MSSTLDLFTLKSDTVVVSGTLPILLGRQDSILHLRVLFFKIQVRMQSCGSCLQWCTWVWFFKQLAWYVPEGKQNGHDIWHTLCHMKQKKYLVQTHVHCASKLECKFRNTFTPILYLVEVASFWLICLFMEQKHV